MWWLNAEVWVQILDGLAFLFVTPEFLKEETLDYLRPKIIDRTEGKLGGVIILVGFAIAGGAGLSWVIQRFYASHASVGELFHTRISGIGALIGYYFMAGFMLILCLNAIVLLILALAVHVAYRRRLLIIGTAIFFVARTLSAWNAMHRGE